MRSSTPRHPFSRRSLLKSSGALALGASLPLSTRLAIQAAAQQATPTRNIAGTELKILQWSHFVPSYDTWFDEFAKPRGDRARPPWRASCTSSRR